VTTAAVARGAAASTPGPPAWVHPTALVEDGVRLGAGTRVWDNAHLRSGAVVGADCIVGGKSYLAGDVVVGDRCKINAMAYLCAGVSLGTGVMVSAQATFTNDRYPRACLPDLSEPRPSEVDEHTTYTVVEDGATIGANATVGSDLVIGAFAMIGMGAVVTRSVPPYGLVVGNPARLVGLVCRCGRPLAPVRHGLPADGSHRCAACGTGDGGTGYQVRDGAVVSDPRSGPVPAPELAERGGQPVG
jgi:acetyltransferase-like isoleucine patch superfamily enzyme